MVGSYGFYVDHTPLTDGGGEETVALGVGECASLNSGGICKNISPYTAQSGVTITAPVFIGGNVSGLASSKSVVLQNNGGDDKNISADGNFTFDTEVACYGNYNVTVKTQPTGQTCSLTNGSGTNVTAEVTNVAVVCVGTPAPAFSKAFSPDTIAYGGTSTLTFTIDNTGSSVDATSLDFTDNLPAGVTVADPASASTTCTGGTLTAVAGSGVISYTGGTVAAGSTCTVQADVASNSSGTHVNTTGNLTSSLGNSGTASDSLNVSTTLGTGNPSSYKVTVTKVELWNGIAYIEVFSGAAQLDMVVGGTFPGINNVNLPFGTYSKVKVTFNNSFAVTGMANYSGADYYTTATTFGGQTNLASTPTTTAGSVAEFIFRNPAWGVLNADVAQIFDITPITVGAATDYQPTLRFTITSTAILMGTAGSPASYYLALGAPTGSLVEP